jgi:hypothetical protein
LACGGLGWPLYDAMFLAAVLSIGSTAMHSGVVSGSFEFGEILMTIGRIGLFLSEEPFCPGVLVMRLLFSLIAKLERYEITIIFCPRNCVWPCVPLIAPT